MDLNRWQQLYLRAERAARVFFAEYFSDVCARCFEAAEARRDPAFNCCRRVNFVPEIISDPLLGDLAEESLGHTLLPLAGPHNDRGCAALGETGCRIPFGRTDTCNSYVCEYLYRCAAPGLPPGMLYRIQKALDLFLLIRRGAHQGDAEYAACAEQTAALEALLDQAAQSLIQHADAFAARKAAVILNLFPPAVDPR